MRINIPNALTWTRIVLIPLFVGVFYFEKGWVSEQNQNIVATAVFILAAVTDWLDGWLARRWNQMSAFGAFLDPVADKLMVAAALIILLQLGRLDALVALIIIGREIAISALREWMAKIGQAQSIAVSYLGKVKTTVQMIAIPLLLYHDAMGPIDSHLLGTVLIYAAALLTLLSMIFYLQGAYRALEKNAGNTQ